MDLTRNEELAALRVLKKQIEERLDDLEGEVRMDLLNAYENSEGDIDSFNIRVAGMKVGKAGLRVPGYKAAIVPGRDADALAFLEAHGLTEQRPIKGWQDRFTNVGGEAVYAETGEICDGIYLAPSRAPYVSFTGFKADDVREAFQARGIEAGDVLRLAGGLDV